MSNVPAPPFAYLSGNKNAINLDNVNESMAKSEAVKQEAYTLTAKIKTALTQHRASIEQNRSKEERELLQANLEDLVEIALKQHQEYYKGDADEKTEKYPRLANLSSILGDYVRQKAYIHFLETGNLLPQSSLSGHLTDEEYLSGVISMNHDLSRYAIGRATERDLHSVLLARDLVSNVLDHLMKYDFRNGVLRRKYGKHL